MNGVEGEKIGIRGPGFEIQIKRVPLVLFGGAHRPGGVRGHPFEADGIAQRSLDREDIATPTRFEGIGCVLGKGQGVVDEGVLAFDVDGRSPFQRQVALSRPTERMAERKATPNIFVFFRIFMLLYGWKSSPTARILQWLFSKRKRIQSKTDAIMEEGRGNPGLWIRRLRR